MDARQGHYRSPGTIRYQTCTGTVTMMTPYDPHFLPLTMTLTPSTMILPPSLLL